MRVVLITICISMRLIMSGQPKVHVRFILENAELLHAESRAIVKKVHFVSLYNIFSLEGVGTKWECVSV